MANPPHQDPASTTTTEEGRWWWERVKPPKGGGMIRQLTWVIMSVVGAIGSLPWVIRGTPHADLIVVGAIVLIVVFALIALWWTLRFMRDHPSVGLMEGPEYLRHERLWLSKKTTQGAVLSNPKDLELKREITLDPSQVNLIDKPDEEIGRAPRLSTDAETGQRAPDRRSGEKSS